MNDLREQIGWFHPDSKRFVYNDQKETYVDNYRGYTIPVFATDSMERLLAVVEAANGYVEEIKDMNEKQMDCPYCSKEAVWVENKEVYGRNYGNSYMIWLCKPCDAFVGCHNNSRRSLGTIANKELRNARKWTKNLFIKRKMDDNWKCNKKTKSKAYMYLNDLMGKTFHFGESTIDELRVIAKDLINLL